MNKLELIKIRSYDPKLDKSFVLATWLKGLYYGDSWFREIPKNIFMEVYHAFLENVISSGKVEILVACLNEDPDVILGYSVITKRSAGTNIHWVFVKAAWRGIGIAKSLVPVDTDTATHLTKVGLSIIKKSNKIVFNPFALTP